MRNLTRGLSFTARCGAGPPGGRQVLCSGEVSRLAAEGDLLTITATARLDREDLPQHRARIVVLDHDNRVRAVIERMPFDVEG